MKRYIEQLIEDINQATWRIKPPHEIWEKSEVDPYDEVELEDISHVEQYIYGEEKTNSQNYRHFLDEKTKSIFAK